MPNARAVRAAGALCALAVAGCAPPETPGLRLADSTAIRAVMGTVNDSLLAHPDSADWPSHGRTRDEQRFSPLHGIDTSNVARLGIAWTFDLGSYEKVEATPIVVGGVLFATGSWNVVHALDARTGHEIWSYDPHVHRRTAGWLCCGAVNRGVAVYRGRVYAGTLDGRLLALDAATGALAWEVMTIDTAAPYSITGAPRVGRGLVFIGNGGADLGVRGYVSAYDAETGALRWRTYTVPGNPALGFESPAMRKAASTWHGRWWENGGGGTAWDAIVFDPESDRLFVGTGNGGPWNRAARSPGGGDNLYLASILALNAADGSLAWYFQTTPGETWDYTATQPMILTELELSGRRHRVIMQAPKNGFFYVLDRDTGAFLRGVPLVPQSWAAGIDSTGRPIELATGVPGAAAIAAAPYPGGAHSWHPMSYSPLTGLVYFSLTQNQQEISIDTSWSPFARHTNRGILIGPTADPAKSLGKLPPQTLDLIAWDPIKGREAWRVRQETVSPPSGTLALGGGIVIAGLPPRKLAAYRASDGVRMWTYATGADVEAGPISYAAGGVQYVAVLAGSPQARSRFTTQPIPPIYRGRARIIAFALGGKGKLPERVPPPHAAPDIGAGELPNVTSADLSEGNRLYDKYCVSCHGPAAASGGPYPDLRFSSAEVRRRFAAIVRDGALADAGMPAFGAQITEHDARALQAYILARARLAMRPGAAR